MRFGLKPIDSMLEMNAGIHAQRKFTLEIVRKKGTALILMKKALFQSRQWQDKWQVIQEYQQALWTQRN